MKYLFLLLLLFSITSPAHADDDTKRIIGGIAAGIVGFALNEMSQDNEAQAEDIQWNDQEKDSGYDREVEDVQFLLHRVGYYNAAIDGLKGTGTIRAIKNFERDYNLIVDGNLNFEEMQVLKALEADDQKGIKDWQQELALKQNNQNTTQSNEADDEDENNEDSVYGKLYEIEAIQAIYATCVEFRESGNPYGYSIDKNIDAHMSDILKLTRQQASQQASCEGKTGEEFEALQKKARKDFAKSDTARTAEMTVAYVIASGEGETDFVRHCNTMSQAYKLEFRRNQYDEINKDTCNFE